VHGALGPTTRKAVKHDKPLKKALLGLRGLAADFPSREARAEGMDEAVLKSKEFKSGDHAHDFPPRAAPPAMTQLWLLRSAVRALSDDRSLFAQKSSLLAEPDLSREVLFPRPPPPLSLSRSLTPHRTHTHPAHGARPLPVSQRFLGKETAASLLGARP